MGILDENQTMKKITPLLFVALMMLVSCGPTVNTQKKAAVDLTNYDSFAYLPNSNVEMPGKSYNDENVNQMILNTINSQMREQGYTIDRDNPDLLVLLSVSTDQETETTTDPVYARYPYASYTGTRINSYYNGIYYNNYANYNVVGYDTNRYQYKEGTLIVDVVDRQSKEIVWTGVSTDGIYETSETAKIREMARAIFEEFPQ